MIRRIFLVILVRLLGWLAPKPQAQANPIDQTSAPMSDAKPALTEKMLFDLNQMPLDCCLVLDLDGPADKRTYLIPYDPYSPLSTAHFLRQRGVGYKILGLETPAGSPVKFRPYEQPETATAVPFQFPFHFISVN